ncbi:MAG: O-antigen ligase family protein [Mycoplasmatota bacterium]|nr:O-antigen ligase family protein [Mycoplasmatota bacterium]
MLVSFFSLIMNGGGLGSLISLYNLLLGILVFSNIKINSKNKTIAIIMILILFFRYCYLSVNSYSNNVYYNGFNSNTVAQIIMFCCLIISLFMQNKHSQKMYIVLFNIFSAYFILKSQSRGALLGILVYVIILLNDKKEIKKINIKYLLILIIFIGSIFPLIYANMYKNEVIFEIPLINKSLYSGREAIYLDIINGFKDNKISIITGLGSNFQLTHYPTLNAHNMYLGLLVNFGIFSFILVIIYLMIIFLNNCNYRKVLPIFALLTNAYFETSMLWPAILMFPCLLITFMQKDNVEERRHRYEDT